MNQPLPPELEQVRVAALHALAPVKPAGSDTQAEKDFLFVAKRTEAGQFLPPYYLVYFLLVDLLGFPNLGKFEKISWSVPIDYDGQAFLIEHRKFGIGVFAKDLGNGEIVSKQIVLRIQKAIEVARPYFDWVAKQAVQESQINVVNNSSALFDRFTYFLDAYQMNSAELERRKSERLIEKGSASDRFQRLSTISASIRLNQETRWIALAAIEAFFSWTEHVLIHLAILFGSLKTASDVADLAVADWSAKFKFALDISDPKTKGFFDKLLTIRRELRNYVAHGAFGKDGEAFHFHSGAGAVPVLLPHRAKGRKFSLSEGLNFDVNAALSVIVDFTAFIWSGNREPAEVYIQKSGLPIILTMATDGTYATALRSTESMTEFVEHMSHRFDQAANMDW